MLASYDSTIALRSNGNQALGRIKENKSLVSMPKRTCEANEVDENSSFIFTVCVKSVPLYHFKLAYVVLQMAVK